MKPDVPKEVTDRDLMIRYKMALEAILELQSSYDMRQIAKKAIGED